MFAWLSVGQGVGLITFEGTDRNTLILPSTVSHLTGGNTEWNIQNIQLSWLRLSDQEQSTEKRHGWVPRLNYQWYQTLESSDLLKSCHHQRSLRKVITLSQAHNSHQITNEYKYWNGFIWSESIIRDGVRDNFVNTRRQGDFAADYSFIVNSVLFLFKCCHKQANHASFSIPWHLNIGIETVYCTCTCLFCCHQ